MGLAKLCGLSGWYFLLVTIVITVGCGAGGNQTARVSLQAQPPVTSDWKPDESPEEPEVSIGELLVIPELRPVSADNLISHGGYASLVKAEFRSANQATVVRSISTLAQGESVALDKKVEGSQPFEVFADVEGSLTDLFITLELPQPATGEWYLKWDDALSSDYFCYSYFNGGNLQLGIAGLRKVNQAIDVSLLSQDELVKLLSERHSISGEVPICILAPGPQNAAGWLEVKAPAKSAVAVDPVTQVTGVEVTAVNGEYEISWPARLLGDYDQNSEVGLSDITPLVMLYYLRNLHDSWVLEAFARTDGNGDGEINLTDITTIVMNYGHSLSQFRVEKATGNAVGPESAWTEVASINRSSITRYGDSVQSLGSPPYQRATDVFAPGWTYYRVVGINRDGIEALPSDAVLAPDTTPPTWPAGDNIAEVENPFGETTVSFAEDATDDRNGLVSYILQVTGGEGDPDDLPIFGEWRDENVYNELTSPYSIHSFYLPPDFEDLFSFKFVIGAQYYVRVLCSDPSGNRQAGEWMGLVPDVGEIEDDGRVGFFSEWDLWVNKEGTIRFTPPVHFYKDGSTMEEYFLTALIPEKEHGTINLTDNDPATKIPYEGGEVVWENAVGKGQVLYLAFVAIGTDGREQIEFTYLKFPELWLKPFDGDFLPSPSRYNVDVFFLSNGTPYSTQHADWLDHYLIYFYGGASVYMDSLEGISDRAFTRSAKSRPIYIPQTSEILFHEPTYELTPGSVTWWKRGQGITAKTTEPPGVFSEGFTSRDFIDRWLMVDQDTLRGVRGEPVEQPDGTLAFELWEAKRNGEMQVKELLVPMEITRAHTVSIRDSTAAKLVLNIFTPGSFFGQEFSYIALLSDDDEWTVIDIKDIPAVINEAEWDRVNIRMGVNIETTPTVDGITYIIVSTQRTISEDPEVSFYHQGVYSGDFFQGLGSFTEVWSVNSDEQLHPDYPIKGVLFLRFHSSTEATTYGTLNAIHEGDIRTPVFYFNADGTIKDVIPVPRSNMFETAGWDDQGYLTPPPIGNVLLSNDGEWLAPQKEGAWGYLYQINQ